MSRQRILICFILFCPSVLHAQQVPDLKYQPPLPNPAYGLGKGPRVGIDEAHHNFHTATTRYQPFAEFLRRDGYRVEAFKKTFTAESLREVDILVIANALHERNVRDWSLPCPSAFTTDEIVVLKRWVEQGGSLFLIADHMPFPGAAHDLAKAFGLEFSNGYARPEVRKQGSQCDIFDASSGLKESVITRGRSAGEKVTSVATFGGSAFQIPQGAVPVLVFGPKAVSQETKRAPGITPDAGKVPIEGWAQGAVMNVGKGRLAAFGEAAMFSTQLAGANQRPMGMNAPEAKQNHQLLLNIMHWLTRVEGMTE